MNDLSGETLAASATLVNEKSNNGIQKSTWTLAELYLTDFPDPKWIVPGLIPEGLTALGGRPKVGKSFMALQVAGAIGTGGRVLDIKVDKGNVLYLALEDNPGRIKERCINMQLPSNTNVTFSTEWKRFREGGALDDILSAIRSEQYNLIVVDTLTKFLGRIDQDNLGMTSEIIGDIQHEAITSGITVLLLDHHRKNNTFEPDPVDDLIGSTGKAIPLDAALGIYKNNGKAGATLMVRGRILKQEIDLSILQNDKGFWQSLGDANAVREDSVKGAVIIAIRTLTELGQLPTAANISKAIGKDRGNITKALADLYTDGVVKRGDKVGVNQPYVLVKV